MIGYQAQVLPAIMAAFWFPFILAMLVAIVVPFTITYIIDKQKLTDQDKFGKKKLVDFPVNEEFVSPMTGHLVVIEDLEDQVFASKAMGDGIAIELTDGKVVAPFSGEIIMTFPSKHAYGIRSTSGTPWLAVNKNHDHINVEASLKDTDSVFYTYQKLIKLRKQYKVIQEGSFIPLLEDHFSIFAYKRETDTEELIVINNFYGKDTFASLDIDPENY